MAGTGKRGPAPQPDKPHSRSGGNRRESSEALNRATQKSVDAQRPTRPAGMTPKAKEIWNEVIDELFAVGLVCRLDGGLLAEYCELMVILQRLRAHLSRPSKAHAYDKTLDQIDKVTKTVTRIGDSFGLTPKGRRAMGIETKHGPGTLTEAGQPARHKDYDPGLVFDGIST